ncbi:hypothetical protein [uncultured Chloroflexus sp.]|uniref:hypothetical protein n=1 Tax=uncultured Chloroflexus sp. TaxID=214040 RepID=UPI00262AB29F|nr:hypothetical protein [uncultured Chloroflexus sp.]
MPSRNNETATELRCSLTGRPLTPEEAYWAPPLITARELVTTFVKTLFTNPMALGAILLSELPDVPYAPEARPLLARRRSVEQAKLLALLLVIAIVVIGLIFWLVR